MNFAKYKTAEGNKFLKYSDYSQDNPLKIKICGEPEKEMFRGKTKFKLPVMIPGGDKKVLDVSQRCLNSLIEAATKAGVLDSIDKVVWSTWVEGESFDTAYFWLANTRQAIQVVKEPAPADEFGVSDVDDDELPF